MIKEVAERQLMDTVWQSPDRVAAFFYTPLCGTCKVARQTLSIVATDLPDATILMCNINLMPRRAMDWKIESVPCLLVLEKGKVVGRLYKFPSVASVNEVLSSWLQEEPH